MKLNSSTGGYDFSIDCNASPILNWCIVDINSDVSWDFTLTSIDRYNLQNTIMHEIGHVLGIGHVPDELAENPQLPEATSIMIDSDTYCGSPTVDIDIYSIEAVKCLYNFGTIFNKEYVVTSCLKNEDPTELELTNKILF